MYECKFIANINLIKKTKIITGGMANQIFVFENESTKELNGHKGPITSIRLHPNLKTIVSGSEDETVRIWSENECQSVVRVHHSAITEISIHPTGHSL